MRRNKSKAFEMSRSILPSTARKMARDRKRAIQHRNRSVVRDQLTPSRGRGGDWLMEFYEDDERDLLDIITPRCDDGWDTCVSERREADKLNHFVRWAKKITDHLDQDEKMDYIRPLLPDGLIGDHAASHLWALEPHNQWNWRTTYERNRQNRRKTTWELNEEFNVMLRDKLNELVANTSELNKFNKALAAHYTVRYQSWRRAEIRNRTRRAHIYKDVRPDPPLTAPVPQLTAEEVKSFYWKVCRQHWAASGRNTDTALREWTYRYLNLKPADEEW